MLWNTQQIKKLIEDRGYKVKEIEHGGDVDTTNLIVSSKNTKNGTKLWICGCVDDGYLEDNRDNVEVTFIEVKDGEDSRGGINTGDRGTRMMYADITSTLMELGWEIIDNIGDYH